MATGMGLAALLYKLQQLDTALVSSERELKGVEAELGDDSAVRLAESRLRTGEEELATLQKRQRSAEWELEDVQAKLNDFSGKLYGGSIKNPKELVNLEAEVKSLKSSVGRREDELLTIMSEVEDKEAKVDRSRVEFERLGQERRESCETLLERKVEIEVAVSRLREDRGVVVAQVGQDALRLYAQIRESKGEAVARVERGKCQGCHIALPTSQWQKARTGELIQCNSCGRILYLE